MGVLGFILILLLIILVFLWFNFSISVVVIHPEEEGLQKDCPYCVRQEERQYFDFPLQCTSCGKTREPYSGE